MKPQKQHDSRVTVEVDGDDLGVWDDYARPDISSETGTYRPGGELHAEATTGLPTVGTTTVSRAMKRDNANRIYRRLIHKVGQAPMKIIDQPLHLATQTPYGDPDIVTGILNQITRTDYSSTGNDDVVVTLTIQPDTRIG